MVLAVPDEVELLALSERLRSAGHSVVETREPDLGDELTAVSMLPSETGNRLVSRLPLALRNVNDPRSIRETALRTQHKEAAMA